MEISADMPAGPSDSTVRYKPGGEVPPALERMGCMGAPYPMKARAAQLLGGSRGWHMRKREQKILTRLIARLASANRQMIGYPVTSEFDYTMLAPRLGMHLNNCGDPWDNPTYKVHTRELERDVIKFFAQLFRAPDDDNWGYVTNGSTEGNLYGLYAARELLPGAPVLYSTASHYSIPKNIHILGLQGVKVIVDQHGEIDYTAFELAVAAFVGKPVILLANIGTTMTEAKDNIVLMRELALKAGVADVYIHCDAALAGVHVALDGHQLPCDFADGADSIAISGHKTLGTPMPCGVVLARRSNVQQISKHIAYLGGHDSTISGSRSGLAAAMLWYGIAALEREGLLQRWRACQTVAASLEQELNALGLHAWRNPMSMTVVFDRPAQKIIEAWQLASDDMHSHVVCEPHVTMDVVHRFVHDVAKSLQVDDSRNAMGTLAIAGATRAGTLKKWMFSTLRLRPSWFDEPLRSGLTR